VWLSLDASTSLGSVAVVDGTTVVATAQVAMRGATEERLMPAVVRAIEVVGGWERIHAVFVGGGPGSFTSLRIAASIAKGIVTARRIPLWSGSSLALAAADASLGDGTFVISLDALRGEVYAQAFTRTGGELLPLGTWRRMRVVDAGSMAERHGAQLVALSEPNAPRTRPHAADLPALLPSGLAGPVELATWEPDYGRLAEAQVVWEARHGRPLPEGGG
jgi:tRNA threonylcarbamoyladenosine biosynthesis protein TsaB